MEGGENRIGREKEHKQGGREEGGRGRGRESRERGWEENRAEMGALQGMPRENELLSPQLPRTASLLPGRTGGCGSPGVGDWQNEGMKKLEWNTATHSNKDVNVGCDFQSHRAQLSLRERERKREI